MKPTFKDMAVVKVTGGLDNNSPDITFHDGAQGENDLTYSHNGYVQSSNPQGDLQMPGTAGFEAGVRLSPELWGGGNRFVVEGLFTYRRLTETSLRVEGATGDVANIQGRDQAILTGDHGGVTFNFLFGPEGIADIETFNPETWKPFGGLTTSLLFGASQGFGGYQMSSFNNNGTFVNGSKTVSGNDILPDGRSNIFNIGAMGGFGPLEGALLLGRMGGVDNQASLSVDGIPVDYSIVNTLYARAQVNLSFKF